MNISMTRQKNSFKDLNKFLSKEKMYISRGEVHSGPPIFNFVLGYPDEKHRG